ncbi:MAG: hypothetical protein M3Y76_11105, partial [Chloroflexota bacterium]|nr:hypothetical protein [Chloroflexota bacterium]
MSYVRFPVAYAYEDVIFEKAENDKHLAHNVSAPECSLLIILSIKLFIPGELQYFSRLSGSSYWT